MNKDSILAGLAVTGVLGLAVGVGVQSARESQRVTDYKNSKRLSIRQLDLYLRNLSADDGYTARYCYDYYKAKFNAASTTTEADNMAYKVNKVVELAKDGSTSSIVELRIMKDRIDEEKEQKKREEERQRQQQVQRHQQQMMKEFAEAMKK